MTSSVYTSEMTSTEDNCDDINRRQQRNDGVPPCGYMGHKFQGYASLSFTYLSTCSCTHSDCITLDKRSWFTSDIHHTHYHTAWHTVVNKGHVIHVIK